MSDHKKTQPLELIQALKDHRLPHDKPSQLADSFRHGWEAARRCAPQWKVVPVEPTEKMISEGSCAQTLGHGHRYIGECAAKTAWSFMLAVAPQPPEGLMTTKPEATPVQMPEAVGVAHSGQLDNVKDGYAYVYPVGSVGADCKLYTEQQVRDLLAGVSAAPAQEGWCDGCSPDNCVGSVAQVQPKPRKKEGEKK